MKQAIVGVDEQLLALEACEQRIRTAIRRGLDLTRQIGAELRKIRDQELYKARDFAKFSDYVTTHLGWDIRTATRVITIWQTAAALESQGLVLPENETQIFELSRLEEPEAQGKVWDLVLRTCEKRDIPITVEVIRVAVDLELTPAPPALETPPKTRVVEPVLKFEDGESAKAEPPARITLSEQGEAALERIRRLCGDPVAAAIEGFRLLISERDLRKWAEQEDQLTKNIAYYVAGLGWTVAKAISYEDSSIDAGTTVERLVNYAYARGGRTVIDHDEARITIEIRRVEQKKGHV